jgi:heat shock protein HslJ
MNMKKMLFFVAIMATTLMACNKQTCDQQTCDQQTSNKQTKVAANTNALAGEWILSEVNGNKIESNTDMPTPFIIFDEKESLVNGNAGCNNFFGNYITDTNQPTALRFDNMGSTKKMCQDMEIEDQFFMAMGQVTNMECNANTLLLKDQNNKVVLKFARK